MYDPQLLESLVRFDPAGRGLAAARDAQGLHLCSGFLSRAAKHLAHHGQRVLIVTGFAVVIDDRVTAETDGPLGALFLASMLRAAGLETNLATDRYAAGILRAGCEIAGLPQKLVVEFSQSTNDPTARDAVAMWRHQSVDSRKQFSHLIFVERAGPSHTIDSVKLSSIRERCSEVVADFERLVPVSERDVCHNMRGESIDAFTAPLYELIQPEGAVRFGPPPPQTIGIVDGGNEIGCGAIEWDVLRGAIASDVAARIACRIRTDYTIPSGVSNWGAYALGASVVSLRSGQFPAGLATLADWNLAKHHALLAALVDAGAVDGVTKRAEATVDGIPLDTYLAQFERIKAAAL